MSYQDFHWHANVKCFSCSHCHKPLFGQPFIPRAEKIFCSLMCSKLQEHQKSGNFTLQNCNSDRSIFDSLRLPEFRNPNQRSKAMPIFKTESKRQNSDHRKYSPFINSKSQTLNRKTQFSMFVNKPSFTTRYNFSSNNLTDAQKRHSLPIFETLATLNDPFLSNLEDQGSLTGDEMGKIYKKSELTSFKVKSDVKQNEHRNVITNSEEKQALEKKKKIDKIESNLTIAQERKSSDSGNSLQFTDQTANGKMAAMEETGQKGTGIGQSMEKCDQISYDVGPQRATSNFILQLRAENENNSPGENLTEDEKNSTIDNQISNDSILQTSIVREIKEDAKIENAEISSSPNLLTSKSKKRPATPFKRGKLGELTNGENDYDEIFTIENRPRRKKDPKSGEIASRV